VWLGWGGNDGMLSMVRWGLSSIAYGEKRT